MADLGAVILVTPPGVDLLSIRIFGLMHAGVEDEVAGICLAMAATFVFIMMLLAWTLKRWS